MTGLLAHLLRVVSFPHWREHRVRTGLTIAGVALGVATIVAVAAVTRTVLASFGRMVDTVAGASTLEVSSAAGPVDETLYVLGMDFLGSSVWRAQLPPSAIDIPDELLFVAQPDSVMLGRGFAARLGVGAGGTVRVVVPSGVRTLHVRGLLGDVPSAHLFSGAVAVMDLPAAQRLLGREGRVDRVAIELAPGAAIAPVRTRLAAALGPALEVAPPEARNAQVEKMLFSLRSMLVVAGSLAVIVGAFIVFHAVALSVEQRRRQFALLDAVGVERSVLMRLCLVETTGLALLGVLLGLTGGRLLGALASRIVGGAASEIWLRVHVEHAALSLGGVAAGGAVGLGVALAAASLAVRTTFTTPTVDALRPAAVEGPRGSRLGAAAVGLLLMAATWLVVLADPRHPWVVVAVVIGSQVIAYIGGALVAPALVGSAGTLLRHATRGWRGLPLRLAVENLPRSPRRAGITVATITAAVGMAVCMAGLVQSFEAAWTGWIEQHFAADVFVGSGARFHLLASPAMDLAVRERLASVPGVASVEPFRVLPTRLAGRPVFLEGISVEDRLAHGGLDMVEGTLAAAAPALRNGTGVLLSDNLAFRLSLHRGGHVTLPTPAGARRFRIEGTFVDYLGSLDLGAVAAAEPQLAAVWHDRSANLFRLWLAPGASAAIVRAEALHRLGPGYYAVTARQFLDAVRSVLRRFFAASWALVLVAVLVGVIGVVNSQLATVADRAAEIAMLRTIGVSRRDLAVAVLLECGAIGALGGLFGLALGGMLGGQFMVVSMRLLTGWRIPFVLPPAPLAAGVLCTALVSAAAGWVPARLAGRLDTRQRSAD